MNLGYVYAIGAVALGLIKGFCAKKISGRTDNFLVLTLLTFARMFLCVAVGFLTVLLTRRSFSAFTVDAKTLTIAFLCGGATSVMLVAWLIAVQKGAYMLLEVFLTLGVLVPVVLGAVFFQEKIGLVKWIGIALLAVSAYIMNGYSNRIRGEKTSKLGYVFLIVSSISNGCMQFLQKWFTQVSSDRALLGLPVCDVATFNFYTYVFSFFLLFAFVVMVKRVNHENDTVKISGKLQFSVQEGESYAVVSRVWHYLWITSLSLFLHSYFTTCAANFLTSSELYPLQQGAMLVFSVVMSAIFFKEPITKTCVLGIFVAIVALLTINVFSTII